MGSKEWNIWKKENFKNNTEQKDRIIRMIQIYEWMSYFMFSYKLYLKNFQFILKQWNLFLYILYMPLEFKIL